MKSRRDNRIFFIGHVLNDINSVVSDCSTQQLGEKQLTIFMLRFCFGVTPSAIEGSGWGPCKGIIRNQISPLAALGRNDMGVDCAWSK
jgi:hypothetical protein